MDGWTPSTSKCQADKRKRKRTSRKSHLDQTPIRDDPGIRAFRNSNLASDFPSQNAMTTTRRRPQAQTPLSGSLPEVEAQKGVELADGVSPGSMRKGLEGDYMNIGLLLVLYTLQGVPMGMSMTMDLILQEKKLSFEEQGVFSSVSWPYSLKILWAPIVDSVFVASVGRRKSWLVPTQILIGVMLVTVSWHLDELLGNLDDSGPRIFELTAIFFTFFFLAATQDIAVDGWAVTMLSRRNIGYASTCNAVGQTFGFMIAFTGYMGLNYYGIASMETFMRIWGYVFIVVTLLIAFIKKEKHHDENGKAEEAAEQGEVPTSIRAAYMQMANVLRLPGVQGLLGLLATRGIAFAAVDGLAQRKLVEKGMKKEHVAGMIVIITPLNIILPGIVSRQTSDKPMKLFKKAYLPRVFLGLLSLALVVFAPNFEETPDHIPQDFLLGLVIVVVCHSVLSTAMFVAMMGFFAQVSDPAIGGTYMTLLNTISNLGSKWPNQLVLFLVEKLTFKECKAEGNCETILDGFVVISIFCFLFGLGWVALLGKHTDALQDLPTSAWRVASLQKR